MGPSRHKKVLRDSMLTHSFFNQVGSGTCSCCAGHNHNHNHATQSLNPGDPDHSKLAETGRGDGTFRNEVSSTLIESYMNLTPEERRGLLAAMETSPVISGLTQALEVAHEQMSDDPNTADHFQSMDTFDLDNLDQVAKMYDKLCRSYGDQEERQMADLADLVGDLAVTANDAKRSSGDRLADELNMQLLNIYSKITVPLNSCLRQIQLFNTEKKFGFEEETYQTICNDDKKQKQHGLDVPEELPLSFRQKLNNPYLPAIPTSKSSKKKEKKKPSGVKALVELQRNVKLAMEEMQELKKTISQAEKPIELPSPPASFRYQNVPVPENIPDHIRQRFFDGDFAHQEVLALQEEAFKQLFHVRRAFSAWYNASHEVWEYGKRHVHEMPTFREYEYTRTSLHMLFYMAARQEVKIVEYYSSEGAPKFPQAMNEAFKLGSLSLEEFEKDWEMRCLEQNAALPSVDKIIADIDEMLKEAAE